MPITYRKDLDRPLTHNEMDDNFKVIEDNSINIENIENILRENSLKLKGTYNLYEPIPENKCYIIEEDVNVSYNWSVPTGSSFIFLGGKLKVNQSITFNRNMLYGDVDIDLSSSTDIRGTLSNSRIDFLWFDRRNDTINKADDIKIDNLGFKSIIDLAGNSKSQLFLNYNVYIVNGFIMDNALSIDNTASYVNIDYNGYSITHDGLGFLSFQSPIENAVFLNGAVALALYNRIDHMEVVKGAIVLQSKTNAVDPTINELRITGSEITTPFGDGKLKDVLIEDSEIYSLDFQGKSDYNLTETPNIILDNVTIGSNKRINLSYNHIKIINSNLTGITVSLYNSDDEYGKTQIDFENCILDNVEIIDVKAVFNNCIVKSIDWSQYNYWTPSFNNCTIYDMESINRGSIVDCNLIITDNEQILDPNNIYKLRMSTTPLIAEKDGITVILCNNNVYKTVSASDRMVFVTSDLEIPSGTVYDNSVFFFLGGSLIPQGDITFNDCKFEYDVRLNFDNAVVSGTLKNSEIYTDWIVPTNGEAKSIKAIENLCKLSNDNTVVKLLNDELIFNPNYNNETYYTISSDINIDFNYYRFNYFDSNVDKIIIHKNTVVYNCIKVRNTATEILFRQIAGNVNIELESLKHLTIAQTVQCGKCTIKDSNIYGFNDIYTQSCIMENCIFNSNISLFYCYNYEFMDCTFSNITFNVMNHTVFRDCMFGNVVFHINKDINCTLENTNLSSRTTYTSMTIDSLYHSVANNVIGNITFINYFFENTVTCKPVNLYFLTSSVNLSSFNMDSWMVSFGLKDTINKISFIGCELGMLPKYFGVSQQLLGIIETCIDRGNNSASGFWYEFRNNTYVQTMTLSMDHLWLSTTIAKENTKVNANKVFRTFSNYHIHLAGFNQLAAEDQAFILSHLQLKDCTFEEITDKTVNYTDYLTYIPVLNKCNKVFVHTTDGDFLHIEGKIYSLGQLEYTPD